MQAQHLTIIAVLVPLSWALLTYFIWHGFLRGKKAGYVAGQNDAKAEARKKIEKSRKGKTTKYSQSGQFFRKFQDNIASKDRSKPNPNIGKLKL